MVIPLHDRNPTGRIPFVVLVIVAINLLVFVAFQPHPGSVDDARFTYEYAAIPCELDQGHQLTAGQVVTGDCAQVGGRTFFPDKHIWLSVGISMFLHAGWLHILGNLLFLWIFGNNVEDYLTHVGFAAFYLLAGAVAFLAHYLSDPASVTPVVGASGAIAGIMGMYLVLWPRARIISVIPPFIFFAVPLPAALVLVVWLGAQFLTSPDSAVAWIAHVGGFGFGMVVGLALRQVRRPRPAPVR